jgi:hypothetical protein
MLSRTHLSAFDLVLVTIELSSTELLLILRARTMT